MCFDSTFIVLSTFVPVLRPLCPLHRGLALSWEAHFVCLKVESSLAPSSSGRRSSSLSYFVSLTSGPTWFFLHTYKYRPPLALSPHFFSPSLSFFFSSFLPHTLRKNRTSLMLGLPSPPRLGGKGVASSTNNSSQQQHSSPPSHPVSRGSPRWIATGKDPGTLSNKNKKVVFVHVQSLTHPSHPSSLLQTDPLIHRGDGGRSPSLAAGCH